MIDLSCTFCDLFALFKVSYETCSIAGNAKIRFVRVGQAGDRLCK